MASSFLAAVRDQGGSSLLGLALLELDVLCLFTCIRLISSLGSRQVWTQEPVETAAGQQAVLVTAGGDNNVRVWGCPTAASS